MPSNGQNSPATDSASTLRGIVGDDATAEFENDPTFVESNPTGNASSENLGAAADVDEDEDGDVDETDEDDLEDDGEEFEDDDEELEDDDLDDEDEDDDLDDEDEDEEDDADEVAASPLVYVNVPVMSPELSEREMTACL